MNRRKVKALADYIEGHTERPFLMISHEYCIGAFLALMENKPLPVSLTDFLELGMGALDVDDKTAHELFFPHSVKVNGAAKHMTFIKRCQVVTTLREFASTGVLEYWPGAT